MFTYNAAAVMVEKTVYSYDDKARLSAETYYDSGEPVAKTVYKYDGLDKPAEIAFFMADGSKATAPVGPCLGAHRVTFSYDQKGKTIGQDAFETDGSQKRGYRWKYDGKGNIAEYFTETSGHSVNFVYRYEFDAKGNWIKRIATGTSIEKGLTVFGKPAVPYVRSTVTKREIAYY